MFKELLLVCALLAALHSLTDSHNDISSDWQNMGDTYQADPFAYLDQSLEYDEDCSWEAEEARQNYTLMLLSNRRNGLFKLRMIPRRFNYIDQLCSATKLLVCDKKSQKCVCGSPGYESLHGVNRSLYTLDENGNCRLNTGAQCVSKYSWGTPSGMGFQVDSKCKLGTTCRTEEGEVCFDQSPSLVENLSGRNCTCKQDMIAEDKSDRRGPVIHVHYHHHYHHQQCAPAGAK